MDYMYGEFSDKQMMLNAQLMHNEIHKLLLYMDKDITEEIFYSDRDFRNYFVNLLYRFAGLNKLLGEPVQMIALMSTLQSAFDEVLKEDAFNWSVYRRLILDAHGYVKSIFEEEANAKS